MNIHLNAPDPNSVPTIRSMDYMTLEEFCWVARLDYDATLEALADSPVTYGGGHGR